MKTHQGFTLIELMIVVAIIGIVAAISLPIYQNFIGSAQVIEGVVLLDGAKVNVEDMLNNIGSFPDTVVELANLNTQVAGNYGDITGTTNITAAGGGDIVYRLRSSGINSNVSGQSIWYSRTSDGVWYCKSNLAPTFAPNGCLSDQTPVPIGS